MHWYLWHLAHVDVRIWLIALCRLGDTPLFWCSHPKIGHQGHLWTIIQLTMHWMVSMILKRICCWKFKWKIYLTLYHPGGFHVIIHLYKFVFLICICSISDLSQSDFFFCRYLNVRNIIVIICIPYICGSNHLSLHFCSIHLMILYPSKIRSALLQWFFLIHLHSKSSRITWYHSTEMAGICGLYERKIRDINPMVPNITYDISDLYNFIDGLADISALVWVAFLRSLAFYMFKVKRNLMTWYLTFAVLITRSKHSCHMIDSG